MNRIPSPPMVTGRPVAKVPAFLGLVAVLVVAAAAGAGYRYGLQSAEPVAGAAGGHQIPPDQGWAAARPSEGVGADAEIEALAARLGAMESEVLRLDALGQRLVTMAGLDAEDFDFDNPPAIGGPDDEGDGAEESRLSAVTEETEVLLALFSDRKRKLEEIERAIKKKDLEIYGTPSSWPVESGYISSHFGYRKHPILKKTRFHSGVDFACKRGTPVLATADGIVTFSGWRSGYGRLVEILHPNGLATRYAHNQANLVKEGDQVRKGQVIAKVGSTGRSTGPHVHFEIRKDGKPINPLPYVGTEPPRADS